MKEIIAKNKSFFGYFFSALLVLAVVLIDPKNDVLGSFNNHLKKSFYLDTCTIKSDTASSSDSSLLQVIEVVDGDTIVVMKDCKPLTIRLIGINSPESVDPRRPVECFGIEASKHAKKILTDQKVRIENDPSQDVLDKYGRTLGYVILDDGTNFNKKQIEDGYAYEYTYHTPYLYQKEFKATEKIARQEEKGLWASTTCNGKK